MPPLIIVYCIFWFQLYKKSANYLIWIQSVLIGRDEISAKLKYTLKPDKVGHTAIVSSYILRQAKLLLHVSIKPYETVSCAH